MVRKSDIDMLNRKIYSYLCNFFKMEKKALLVSGARHGGKTFAIRKVGKECFADVVEFNFLNNPKYREAFKSPSDAKKILLLLSALAEKKLIPGTTLVFFDEVQECPEMVTAIKFLVEEGSYLFKLFMSDVRLLASQYAANIAIDLLTGKTEINNGAIYENFAAQELRAHGYNLYYFNNKK